MLAAVREFNDEGGTIVGWMIRQAVEDDLPAVMELLRLKAEFDGCPDSFGATDDKLRRAFFSVPPRASALLAEIDGAAIGLATYFSTFSTFLARPGIWLDDLYVREEYRSRGVGKAILIELARIARESDCGRIEWTVALGNKRGVAFYERNGADVCDLTRCVRLDESAIERLSSQSL